MQEPRKPRKPIAPRDFTGARLLRKREPYALQRLRQPVSQVPRPPQPAIQPNQLQALKGEQIKTNRDYWNARLKEYEAQLKSKQLNQSIQQLMGGR